MNDEKVTMPTMQTLLDAINGWRQETKERLDKIEAENAARHESMRLQLMSVEVRLERVEVRSHEVLSVAHQALAIAKNVKADVIVLREEVYSWLKDVSELQKLRKVAETLV